MEGKTILVVVLLATLGIAVAVAAADATRAKTYRISYGRSCEYPSSPALGLAIAATMALVLARTIITTTTGGCCSFRQQTPNEPKYCARVCIILSWITSSIAVILFIMGIKLSTQNTMEGNFNDGYYCSILSPGVFSGAGIVGLVSVFFGLLCYILYVLDQRCAAKKSGVDLELEKQPVPRCQETNNQMA